jgi:hypothetical protein
MMKVFNLLYSTDAVHHACIVSGYTLKMHEYIGFRVCPAPAHTAESAACRSLSVRGSDR